VRPDFIEKHWDIATLLAVIFAMQKENKNKNKFNIKNSKSANQYCSMDKTYIETNTLFSMFLSNILFKRQPCSTVEKLRPLVLF